METDAGIKALLDEGTQRHLNGDVTAAAALYERVLASHPNNAEALNLLGCATLQCDGPEGAIPLLRKAVSIDSSNPGCLNNLGQALEAAGDFTEAAECYRAALKIEPNARQCLGNLGMALYQLGHLDDALTVTAQALAVAPDDPELHHNAGVIFQGLGRLDESIDSYRRAIQYDPCMLSTYASLASALYERGEQEEALQCCLRAVEFDPLCIEAHEVFRKLAWDMGAQHRMYHSYLYACEHHPNSSEAYANLGAALVESQEWQDATTALRQSVALDPRNARAHSQLGCALCRTGNFDEAISAHLQAIDIDDSDALFYEELGNTRARGGDFIGAADAFLSAHQRNPRRSSALASLTIARNEMGDPSVADLVDYDAFVTTRVIDVPQGFETLAAFNRTLHEELLASHVERPEPIGQTMRGGTQNRDNLFRVPTGAVRCLRTEIERALTRYIESLEADPNHPFLRYVNKNFRFTGAWSTILYESGYDGSHIHNEGWLSGVYYVAAPEIDAQASAAGEGCIQFGEPPRPFCSVRNRTARLIRPQPGLAVFFPSYYWHGVQPFRQEGLRHSVAFDVV
ncbi:MAG: tetratricopeptide repeat protein [Alphaproteobacteria bacterium]|nr:tetratricopeptide repeat protein [Alphaproteobacteria bacterium]